MKLIEKLAIEYVEKATHPESDPHFKRAISATWQAGFRKCREMATEASRKEGANSPDLIYDAACENVAKAIENLGEE